MTFYWRWHLCLGEQVLVGKGREGARPRALATSARVRELVSRPGGHAHAASTFMEIGPPDHL